MSEAEGTQKMQSSQEKAPLTGGLQINFEWNKEPQQWGGFSKDELISLANDAADFFGIPDDQKSKIRILFADNHTFLYSDGTKATTTARHNPAFSEKTGKFLYTDIVINRSMEVLFHTNGVNDDFLKTREVPKDYDYEVRDKVIYCTLRSPWEAVAWFVAEEINHAYLDIKFGNKKRGFAVKNRFKKTSTEGIQHRLGIDTEIGDHAINVYELTAARQVLRFLEKIAKFKDPKRASFFRSMYDKSIKERFGVISRTALILEQLYIWTGFKPDPDDIIIHSE